MKYPIGVDNFKELIEEGYSYVDKSLFIEEITDNSAKVLLITRPRRFGKTLNMNMLAHFFDHRQENRHLFKGLAIEDHPSMEQCGSLPVIFLTFKKLKARNFELFQGLFRNMMADLYRNHLYLMDHFNSFDLKEFNAIASGEASENLLIGSLTKLMQWLHVHHGKRVLLLIDEYDNPIQEAFAQGYYPEVISFMQGVLGNALKGNDALHKGVLTGILRIAKASIFSDLNNLEVVTVLDKPFCQYFGFTEDEVISLLEAEDQIERLEAVRRWYNGYQIGSSIVYNPWSVINDLRHRDEPCKTYWLDTSSNSLVHQLILEAPPNTFSTIEHLMQKGTIKDPVNPQSNLYNLNPSELWSLLLYSGYLTLDHREHNPDSIVSYHLRIPNLEVWHLYKSVFYGFFDGRVGSSQMEIMLQALTRTDLETFSRIFRQLVTQTLSYFDTQGPQPERFYHAFVLGLLAYASNTHHIRSNRESGFGRYDLMMIPKRADQRAVIFEFKSADSTDALEHVAQNALDQIEAKDYRAELYAQGFQAITELGIAFYGKQVHILERQLT